MKKVALGIIIGVLMGLFVGGLYWSNQYMKLNNRYNGAIELLKLYKNYYENTNTR